MLFITQNCLYCLYVTAWFLKRWNKLWKPQQGSLLNIKSMHYICWNPGEPKAAVPNSRVCPQQEPCGKCLHLGSKLGLWAVILWKLFGGSSVEVLELGVLPSHLQQLFWYSWGCEEPWTIQGRMVRGLHWAPWLLHGLAKAPSELVFSCFSREKFSTFFSVLKDGKFYELTKTYQHNRLQWSQEATKSSQHPHTDTFNVQKLKKKTQKWRLYCTELSKCLRSVCPPTVYTHRNQSSWEQRHKTPWKPCRMLCSVPCGSEAAPTTAHPGLQPIPSMCLLRSN